MTQMQRPAYLTGVPDLSERATQGIGTVLPPHVSIRGNKFTLVDGAGNKKLVGDTMDFLVADIGDHGGKMYYADPNWTPDSNDPPDCFSMNGVGPSRDAIRPPMLKDNSRQVKTCAECPMNERGSRISKMSGAEVKACRDEILTAIVYPQFPSILFKLTITPGSFKNWQKHVEECKNISKDDHVGTILTRATFADDKSGVLVFKAVSYPDEASFKTKLSALAAKATDLLVGRLDRPRELPAPTATQQIAPPTAAQSPAFGEATATQQVSAEPEQPKRARGRPRSQPEQLAAAGQPTGPIMAPFRPDAPAAQPNGGASFGIQQAPGPSADIQASLDAAFGKPTGGTSGGGAFGS